MAAPANYTSLALRGSQGIRVINGTSAPVRDDNFPSVDSRNCKVMTFSKDGSLFAFCDGQSVSVLRTDHFGLVLQVSKPRTTELEFSPDNSLLTTWEPYIVTKDNPQGSPNLNLWEVKTGRNVRGLFQKKKSGWCPQWSSKEEICGRNVNNEIHFYEKNSFESPVHKLHLLKVVDFKLTNECREPFHVAAYVPGSKGQPSFVRVYRYPNFGGPQAAVANKSFYQADKVDLLWNNKGTALLVLTATESSADSYYGDQGLHYVGTDSLSCLVPRGKNGPVYSVEWNPKSTDFCVVYGFMPAKATMYNLKCEPVFDFGTGPRNITYYNPFGNVLCLAGFGNLGGNMEFWDTKSQKMIAKIEARDSTFFEWCPDGRHLVTATCSPRLRVGNGIKFWDFTGAMLYEEQVGGGEELWDVCWKTVTQGTLPEPRPPAMSSSAKQEMEAKPQAYVPPALRGMPHATMSKYREGYEPASNVKQQQQQPAENLSKAALKNRKKKEAKARAKEQQPEQSLPQAGAAANDVSHQRQSELSQQSFSANDTTTGDAETDKKLRNLNKKLRQVQQLKEQQASGKQLEINQLEKLKSEASLIQEIQDLQLG